MNETTTNSDNEIPLVFFDTETTGKAHKHCGVVEAGFIKQIGGKTVDILHLYFQHNPADKWEDEAQKVHGLSREFLKDKPLFEEKAQDIINFITGCDMVAHNAQFDVDFLNKEFARAKFDNLFKYVGKVHDTLKMAKAARPGKKNSLDALTDEYKIDRTKRADFHGALIDTELLIEVYYKLQEITNGRIIDYETDIPREPIRYLEDLGGFKIPSIMISEEDLKANEAILNDIEKEEKITPIARAEKGVNVQTTEKKEEKTIKFSLI